MRIYRLDTADFPRRMRFSARNRQSWCGTVETTAGRLHLEDVTAVYYRKPRDFDLPDGLSGPERRFARAQARVGIGGVLTSLRVRWMNMPSRIADAEYKPVQLDIATRVGFATPPTLITNDPEQLRSFAEDVGEVVVKPLAEPIVHEGGGCTSIYTRRLSEHDLADLKGVDVTAHLFQQYVPKAWEARVTVVGRRAFAVAIHAGSPKAEIDWRADYPSLRYEVVECPESVTEAIRHYLDSFGLTYGAFDFVITPSDEAWVFLECNASGQWGWLAEECQLPIAAAIADELTAGDHS